MDSADILGIVSRGEDTRHQFKLDVKNAKSVGAELAAFANGVGACCDLIDTPTRLLLFDDRIEIVSPGLLTGGLTASCSALPG